METITLQEFQDRCRAQGVPREHMAFICPRCGTVQSMASLRSVGCPPENLEKAIGHTCEGVYCGVAGFRPFRTLRETPLRGCDFYLGPRHSQPDLVVTYRNHSYGHFQVASPEEAQSLRKVISLFGELLDAAGADPQADQTSAGGEG